jgi:prepilin-type processing-associated H-X9-DG protein
MGDNENLASVKLAAGSPWWTIGDQSQNAQSNTRFAWQLIKQNYAKPEDFICAGHKAGIPVSNELLQQLNDFPSRNHISYSFMIICDKTASMKNRPKQIIMGDMNPVFRRIPKFGNTIYNKLSEPEKVVLSEQLKKMSSPNHSGRGQNVLYCDGSVVFVKQRTVDGDDIFTLRGVDTYTGTETPADKNDIFLVP